MNFADGRTKAEVGMQSASRDAAGCRPTQDAEGRLARCGLAPTASPSRWPRHIEARDRAGIEDQRQEGRRQGKYCEAAAYEFL